MKKDLIFAPILLAIGILLALLQVTGMPVHIALSVAGVLVLAVYTSATKKEWKLPALEIAMRACYGIALISGIVIVNVTGILFLNILHKVFCALFLAGLVAVVAHKFFVNKAGK